MHTIHPEKASALDRHLVKHLDGIFKPISAKSPCISKGKFLGILVFNPLLPSDHDWQTCQSTSSGLRRLNRGSCHTPKFALMISLFSNLRISFHMHTLP